MAPDFVYSLKRPLLAASFDSDQIHLGNLFCYQHIPKSIFLYSQNDKIIRRYFQNRQSRAPLLTLKQNPQSQPG